MNTNVATGTKVCAACGKNKPLAEFYNGDRARPGSVLGEYYKRAYCKECCKDKNRANKPTNKIRSQAAKYRSSYGIDRELSFILADPRNRVSRCPLCKETKTLVIDHNHATKKVRGLICQSCNQGLGFFRDNVDALYNAIEYLKKDSSI